MKNRLSRWIALGTLSLGMLATDQGQAYFSGSEWGWPYPEDDGFLGQGDTYGWNGSSYDWGWAIARYDGDLQNFGWAKVRNDNGDWDPYQYAGSASQYSHLTVEDYFDGELYDYGQCRIWGFGAAEGGCD